MRTLRDMSRGLSSFGSINSNVLLRLAALSTPLLMMGLLAAPAHAADHLSPASCEQNAAESAVVEHPDLLDPTLRGVGLEDLDGEAAQMVASYLRLKGTLPLNEVMATAIVERHSDCLVVDVVGRAFRFGDTDTVKNKNGRIGVMRVSVPVSTGEGLCDVGEVEEIDEWSLTELDLHYRVSITEWGAVMEDKTIGFRRVFPLGGGGIDRGVRYSGIISSMTPVIADGLLEKKFAWRELGSPWYFRNKPYLPISIPRSFTRPDGSVWKTNLEGLVAFHIWQDKGFERGFFSHGCMRMRSADLAELAAYIFGQRAPIPVALTLDPLGDARHPYPLDTAKYWQLKNFGTAAVPLIKKKYMLHEMELGTEPLPTADQFVGMTWNSKPILPAGTPIPKATKVYDPWTGLTR